MPQTTPHVTISSLSKVFGSARGDVVALSDVTMEVGRGEFVSLLGPSGCGKSTLLKIVAGLEDRSAGDVQISGAPLKGCPEGLGFVFQRDVLLDWRTILDNVLLPAEFKNLKRPAFEGRARELLALFGLRGFETRYPWELSGGMRQRVAICRALLIDPDLLLMDEPFGALDVQTKAIMQTELLGLWEQLRPSVLFITHDLDEAVALADRVLIMTSSPGTIKESFEIDLPRPRGEVQAIRHEPRFLELQNQIWASLKDEVDRAYARTAGAA